MARARCGGFLTIEDWGSFVDDVRERQLQTLRCMDCGTIDDPVIL